MKVTIVNQIFRGRWGRGFAVMVVVVWLLVGECAGGEETMLVVYNV
jgi:hypothetical protein